MNIFLNKLILSVFNARNRSYIIKNIQYRSIKLKKCIINIHNFENRYFLIYNMSISVNFIPYYFKSRSII